MNLLQRVQETFTKSIEIKTAAMRDLPNAIVAAAALMQEALLRGNKILACGNGGSASDAQHFVAELVNRFLLDRAPLAAIALHTDTSTLTAIANDFSYAQIFAKQVQALGKSGDILLAISTSGNSPNVIEAVKVAQTNGIRVVALLGGEGGELGKMLNTATGDIGLVVASHAAPRAQEVHILIIHCICDLVEHAIFRGC